MTFYGYGSSYRTIPICLIQGCISPCGMTSCSTMEAIGKNSSRRVWLMLAFNEKMKQLRFNFTAGLQSSYISKAGSLTFRHLLALMGNRRQYLGACTAKRFMHRKLGKARTCLKGTGFVHQPVNFLKTLLAPIACVNITPVQKCLPSSTCAPVSTEPPGPTSEV